MVIELSEKIVILKLYMQNSKACDFLFSGHHRRTMNQYVEEFSGLILDVNIKDAVVKGK